MTNNRNISKDVQLIAFLSVLLVVQILVLTLIIKYATINDVADDKAVVIDPGSTEPYSDNENKSESRGSNSSIVFELDNSRYDEPLKGDANGDGVLTQEDLDLINDWLISSSGVTDEQLKMADYDGDGKLTAADARKLYIYLKEDN